MEPIQCNTLADFPQDRYALLIYCSACHRRAALNRGSEAENISIPQLRARLVCSECGSRSTELHIVWHGSGGSPLSAWGGVAV
jgi:hypothetical protein